MILPLVLSPRSLLLYRGKTQAGWLKEFAQFSLAIKSALQLALDLEDCDCVEIVANNLWLFAGDLM